MKSNDSKYNQKTNEPKIKRKKSARPSRGQQASLGKIAVEKRDNRERKPSLLLFTLQVIYKNLYVLGITLLRRKLRAKRWCGRVFRRWMGSLHQIFEKLRNAIGRWLKQLIQRIRRPFLRIITVREALAPAIAEAKANRKIPVSSYLRIVGAVLRMLAAVARTIVNYLAPVAAAWLLVNVVNMYTRQPLALAVEYHDEIIGYVKSESDFEAAAQTLRDRFISTSTSDVQIEIPKFTLVGVVPEDYQSPGGFLEKLLRLEIVPSDYTPSGELADRMVQASGSEIEHAYGFYVDGDFYGAVTDREFLTSLLQRIREENRLTDAEEERVEFIKSIAVKEGLYPTDSVVAEDSIESLAYSNETVDQVYIAQIGDTPSGIAGKTGVPMSTIISLNPGIENALYEGQEVYLAVAQPFLAVKNIATIVYEEEAPYSSEEVKDSMKAIGYRSVDREGVPGIQEIKAEVTLINGVETERTVLETRLVREPQAELVTVGTQVTIIDPQKPPPQSDGFIWPTVGGHATTYANHSGNGVDIARPAGTPIYASRAGRVTKVEYGYTGYGIHVIVDHGDGYSTLYAHASSLNVSYGDYVTQGQVLGGIGRTGWATGNHVHFEIRYNGRGLYPIQYIGTSG